MAQSARVFDSVSYDEADIAELANHFYGASFVLPVENHLRVESSGAGDAGIVVDTGRAVHSGWWYENTESVAFTLSAQGGGENRLDRVVLRKDAANNQIRLYVIEGTPAVAPSLPALTADDIPLFYVWVADGFGAASTVANADIHDEREMFQPSPLTRSYGTENILFNGEFLAYSDAAGTNNYGPEGWQLNRTTATCAATALAGTAPRGRSLDLTIPGPHTDQLRQYLLLSPDYDDPENSWYTLRGSMEITSGEVNLIIHDGSTALVTKTYKRTGDVFEFVIRIAIDLSASLSAPSVYFESNTASVDFVLNPIMMVRGVMPGPYDKKHEIIKHDYAVVDAGWADSIIAAGTTSIDLSAAFGPVMARSVLGILGRVRARDTLSSTGTASSIVTKPSNRAGAYGNLLSLGRKTNDTLSESQFFVTVQPDATWGFDVVVQALGVFRTTVEMMGVAT